MSTDPVIDADQVRELLDRIGGYLSQQMTNGDYHPDHPTTLLFAAEEMLEDLAMRCGLLEPPRTVRKTDWARVEATTDEEIVRQIKEDCTEPLDQEWFDKGSRTLPEPKE